MRDSGMSPSQHALDAGLGHAQRLRQVGVGHLAFFSSFSGDHQVGGCAHGGAPWYRLWIPAVAWVAPCATFRGKSHRRLHTAPTLCCRPRRASRHERCPPLCKLLPAAAALQSAEWMNPAGSCGRAAGLRRVGPFLPASAHQHDFADQRGWHGLPCALDVLSNLPFAVAGGVGLVWLRRLGALRLCPATRATAGAVLWGWCSRRWAPAGTTGSPTTPVCCGTAWAWLPLPACWAWRWWGASAPVPGVAHWRWA